MTPKKPKVPVRPFIGNLIRYYDELPELTYPDEIQLPVARMINRFKQDVLNIKEVRRGPKGTVELVLTYPLQARRLRPGMEFTLPRTTGQVFIDLFLMRNNDPLIVLNSDHDRGIVELTQRKIKEN